MNFISFAFLIFLGVVLVARLLAVRTGREPVYLYFLVGASLLFYAWHVPAYLAILLFSTIIDYVAARKIERYAGQNSKSKAFLLLSLAANLGVLAFFKYCNFALDSLTQVATFFNLDAAWVPRLHVILPMGISFYTFQSMSYTIDVYRGVLKPIHSFWRFLLYVAFFPQLVAGPIVRARDFLYQINRQRSLNIHAAGEGTYLIIRGLFLKMVVADNIGPLVNRYWAYGSGETGDCVLTVLLALLFGCQIFADFAGYSSIARGVAYLLGFRLTLNFNAPYIASSFSNFWRRWHISLSQWMRDYLYLSLGGNRISPLRTYINLLVVMLLAGLWHGAAYTFIFWGLLHATALITERLLGLSRHGASHPPWLRAL
jgi:D-alanyl-lipoteichoic acid acyltransferase DltB (MBOAT superfamily)